MARADEAACAGAFTTAVLEFQLNTEEVGHRVDETVFELESLGRIGIGGPDITAGIAVIEVGQLGITDKTADAVGVSVVLVRIAIVLGDTKNVERTILPLHFLAHIAADIDRGEALVECQDCLVFFQLTGDGAVGLGITNQTADSTLAADTIPVLGCFLGITGLAQHLGFRKSGVAGVQIGRAFRNVSVVAACAQQCAGSRIIRLVVLGLEVIALDDGVDYMNAFDAGIHIAEQTCKAVDICIRRTGVECCADGVLCGIDVQVPDLNAIVVLQVRADNGGMGCLIKLISQGGNSGIGVEDAGDNVLEDTVRDGIGPVLNTVVEFSGAEEGRIMDRNEVGECSGRSLIICVFVDLGSTHNCTIGTIIVIDRIVPVDVLDENNGIYHLGDGG